MKANNQPLFSLPLVPWRSCCTFAGVAQPLEICSSVGSFFWQLFKKMYVCVWGHARVCVYAYVWRTEVNTGCCSSHASHLVLWDRVSHWDLKLSSSSRLVDQQAPAIYYHAWIFVWILRVQLYYSCWYGEYFTYETTASGPCHFLTTGHACNHGLVCFGRMVLLKKPMWILVIGQGILGILWDLGRWILASEVTQGFQDQGSRCSG